MASPSDAVAATMMHTTTEVKWRRREKALILVGYCLNTVKRHAAAKRAEGARVASMCRLARRRSRFSNQFAHPRCDHRVHAGRGIRHADFVAAVRVLFLYGDIPRTTIAVGCGCDETCR